MKIDYIKHEANRRLLLIFAGWGMDSRPFSGLRAAGYDIAVAWDYTSEEFDAAQAQEYSEVVVIGWSMGVFEGSRIIGKMHLPVTLMIAVNGTLTPVDDARGIPVNVFDATLASLSEASLARFNRRMCRTAERLTQFTAHAPARSIGSLREELDAIGRRARIEPTPEADWDVAVAGRHDMIFPAAAQLNAWQGTAIIETDEPHLPDFQQIIDRLIVDKEKVASRFAATREGYDRDAEFQHSVGHHLINQLARLLPERSFESAVEIGAGSGQLAAKYTAMLDIRHLELWDIAETGAADTPAGAVRVTDDAETRLKSVADGSLDLIISASTIQWFNSPLRALKDIERVLKPGGIAALSFYVEGTYSSVGRELGTTLHYVDPAAAIAAIRHSSLHFSELKTDAVEFPSTRSLLSHIRSTGVNAAGHASTSALRKVLTDNSLRTLEYKTIYLIFKKL